MKIAFYCRVDGQGFGFVHPKKLTSSASFSPSIRISLRLKIHQAQAKNFCRVLDIRVPEIVRADVKAAAALRVLVRAPARRNGQARIAVEDIAHRVQPGAPAGGPNRSGDRLTGRAYADQFVVSPACSFQSAAQRRHDRYIADGTRSFRGVQYRRIDLEMNAMPNVDQIAVKVNIAPCECQYFAAAQAGEKHNQGPQPGSMRLPVIDDEMYLPVLQAAMRAFSGALPADTDAGIEEYEPVGHGGSEYRVGGHLDFADRGFGIVGHGVRVLLDVYLSDLGELHLAEPGAQTLRVQLLRAVARIAGLPAIGGQPGVYPLPQRLILRLNGHAGRDRLTVGVGLLPGFLQRFSIKGLSDALPRDGIRARVHADTAPAIAGHVARLFLCFVHDDPPF